MNVIRANVEGYKIAFKIVKKRAFAYSALNKLFMVLGPLAALAFSAVIIDALTVWDYRTSVIGSLAAIFTVFALKILEIIFNRAAKAYMNPPQQWTRSKSAKSVKFATMRYEETEPCTQLLADINARENASGMGIGTLFTIWDGLCQHTFSVIASFILFVRMFAGTSVSNGSFIASWQGNALLAAAIFAPVVYRAIRSPQAAKKQEKLFAGLPKANNLGAYYEKYLRSDGAAKEIRIFNQTPVILRDARRTIEPILGFYRVLGRTDAYSSLVGGLSSGLMYVVIGLRTFEGIYTLGDVTRYVGAPAAFSLSLAGLTAALSRLNENAKPLIDIINYFNLPDLSATGTKAPETGAIEFRNVSYKYPGREEYALKNVNLSVPFGEHLAIVGRNGSGKTTLIKLLTRLIEPCEGEITLNVTDIREYDYDAYIALFAAVYRDFALTSLTLGENIAASANFDATRVSDALEKAGAKKLPLETYLGKDFSKDGENVSGGEAQKFAIARAIYKNAPFVVLDEPTAVLDPLAESEVYESFDRITGGKTAIYISHRLSSCRFCGKVAVFDAGCLAQTGKHEELLKDTQGKYRELWDAQAQYYTSERTLSNDSLSIDTLT